MKLSAVEARTDGDILWMHRKVEGVPITYRLKELSRLMKNAPYVGKLVKFFSLQIDGRYFRTPCKKY